MQVNYRYQRVLPCTLYVGLVHAAPPTQFKSFTAFSSIYIVHGHVCGWTVLSQCQCVGLLSSGVGKCIKIGGHQLELHARTIVYPRTLLIMPTPGAPPIVSMPLLSV